MNPNPPHNVAEVSEQICRHLAEHLARTQPEFNEALHAKMSFDYLGLDSVSRVELIGLLARDWRIELEPTAAYDFVTIGALAEYLWSELSGEPMPDEAVLTDS